jgi:hypothetical protein
MLSNYCIDPTGLKDCLPLKEWMLAKVVEGMLSAELLDMGELLTSVGLGLMGTGVATSETGVGIVGFGAGAATALIGVSVFGAGAYGAVDFLGLTERWGWPQIVAPLCKQECK